MENRAAAAVVPGAASFALLDAAAEAVIVATRENRIVFANREAERLFRRQRGALEGAALGSLLSEGARQPYAQWLATGPDDAPFRSPSAGSRVFGLRGDGSEFPLEISIGKTGPSEAPLVIAIARETLDRAAETDTVATEERRASTWLEALLEFAPAFIIAVNPEGAIEYINRVLPQYSKKDVIGSFWLQYFPPDVWPMMKSALSTVLSSGAGQTYEVATAGPDGQMVYFSSQVGAIRNGEQIVGAVLVSQDVTETKRTQAELLTARRMALLGTVAAGVAHEINTPIQFVGDSIHFLRDATRDILGLFEKLHAIRRTVLEGTAPADAVAAAFMVEQDADFPYLRDNMPLAFNRCIEGLDRVATIVRSLKEFAHPAEKDMVVTDINHAIQNTLTIAAHEYKYVAVLETEFGDIPHVTCHGGEISQALLNVVVNAAHSISDVVHGTEQKGTIGIRTKCEGDTVVISISDTGTGIPEANRARLFDPFFTTKEVGKGTGQGLSIALSTIVEKHGGELYFQTEVGKGTTFFIKLGIDGKGVGGRSSAASARVDGSLPREAATPS
jgi:PAS domain S-box-containing protein